MVEKQQTCSSCKKRVANMQSVTKFLCPKCGKSEIIRCAHCKEIVVKYTCPNCGFVGPN